MKEKITAERARELLDYNPETGEFKWKITRGKAKKGELAARPTAEGKALLRIDGVLYQAGQIAWLMHYGSWPVSQLLYRSGSRHDCRVDNLVEPSTYNIELTAEIARELLTYEPETGEFRWKVGRGGMMAGEIAGHLQEFRCGKIYRVIRILGTLHVAHRIGWLIVKGKFPDEDLDHKNGDSTDNRLDNLREATDSQNMMNKAIGRNNKSGYKGVSWDSINSKWVARIRVPKGKYKNLGRFLDAEEAHRAYCVAANELYGEFARFA